MTHMEPQVKKPVDPAQLDKLVKNLAGKASANVASSLEGSPTTAVTGGTSSVQPRQKPVVPTKLRAMIAFKLGVRTS